MISPFFKKLIAGVTLAGFLLTSAAPAHALDLPAPGTMVAPGGPFNPPLLKGIRVYPDDAMRFDFILDKGDDLPPGARTGQGEFSSGPQEGESSVSRPDTERLIGYFLASLTTPSSDMWVNLSPYEGNRIIPEKFGLTTMGAIFSRRIIFSNRSRHPCLTRTARWGKSTGSASTRLPTSGSARRIFRWILLTRCGSCPRSRMSPCGTMRPIS